MCHQDRNIDFDAWRLSIDWDLKLLLSADTASQQSSWIAIVVDHAERIADQTIMALLTRLRELTGMVLTQGCSV